MRHEKNGLTWNDHLEALSTAVMVVALIYHFGVVGLLILLLTNEE